MKRGRFEKWLNLLSGIAIVSFLLYILSFWFPNLTKALGQITNFRDISIVSEEAAVVGEELLPAVVLL
jgi:hypothetical protein